VLHVEDLRSTARLHVGNLAYSTTKETLEKVFSAHGQVVSVNLITDYDTGRPKGFAFAEMSTPQESGAVKMAPNGSEVNGGPSMSTVLGSRSSAGRVGSAPAAAAMVMAAAGGSRR
jgi:RNA recognition motif-containing protein